MRYHLELTGFVGKENFNSSKTDNLLRQYPEKHVDVLIDSTGGSLAHGLSIAGAFRSHGDVTAHLRGMCASAATIAAMGAKHICIEPDAFFLVHKVLMSFFDWSSHNADSLQQYIEALQEVKKDLETLDSSVAATYANRCKKPVKDLLQLMKEGKWLTAQQALEWGFVDEISQTHSNHKVSLTEAQANIFAAQGLPIPPVDIVPDANSFISELKNSFKSFFNMNNIAKNNDPEANTVADETQDIVKDLKNQIEALQSENLNLKNQIEAFNKKPAEATSNAVNNPQPKSKENEENEYTAFFKSAHAAADLFNSLP